MGVSRGRPPRQGRPAWRRPPPPDGDQRGEAAAGIDDIHTAAEGAAAAGDDDSQAAAAPLAQGDGLPRWWLKAHHSIRFRPLLHAAAAAPCTRALTHAPAAFCCDDHHAVRRSLSSRHGNWAFACRRHDNRLSTSTPPGARQPVASAQRSAVRTLQQRRPVQSAPRPPPNPTPTRR